MTVAETAHQFEQPRLLTVAEYLELGETPSGYSELTEGRVLITPSAAFDHNYCADELRDQIKGQLPPHLLCVRDLDVDLGLAPPDQPGYCRRPDVLVVKRSARDRIRREGGILRALDVVVAGEVISPGSRRTDTVVKRAEYADAGIPHYWILDLTEPVSLLALHLAGEFGYAVTGEHVGRIAIIEPFAVHLIDASIRDAFLRSRCEIRSSLPEFTRSTRRPSYGSRSESRRAVSVWPLQRPLPGRHDHTKAAGCAGRSWLRRSRRCPRSCSPHAARAGQARPAVARRPGRTPPRRPPSPTGRYGRAGRRRQGGGQLNMITLPANWANYGTIMKTFTRQVRHQDHQRQPRRLQPGRDQRRQAAQGPGPGARRARPRPVVRDLRGEGRPARPVQGRHLGQDPRRRQGRRRQLVLRLRRLRLDRLRPSEGPDAADVLRRPAQARVQEPGRDQRQPDPGGRRVRRGLRRRAGQRRHRSTTSSPGVDFFKKLKQRATSCRSPARPPPCRAGRRRS